MNGLLIAAWLDVRSKPLRTLASTIGMTAAIVAVVVINAAGVLSRTANAEFLARNYGLPVTLGISALGEPDEAESDRMLRALTGNGFDTLSTSDGWGVYIHHQETSFPSSMSWVSSTYRDIRIVDLTAGAWPRETSSTLIPHAVISENLAANLGFPRSNAIGQVVYFTIASGGTPPDFRTAPLQAVIVDGVARVNRTTFGDSEILIVSDLPSIPFHGSVHSPNGWLLRVNERDVPMVQSLLGSFINQNGPLFSVRRVDESEDLTVVLDQQDVTAWVVSIVAFIVGGLGIFGVGLAGVRERAREFGLRRALGASARQIFLGVLFQTMLEVFIAIMAALSLAAIIIDMFARQLVLESLPLPASTLLPLHSAIIGIVGAATAGFIAAIAPAITAARVSVIQALRS